MTPGTARADDLDDQYSQLQSQIASAQGAVGDLQAKLSAALASLQQSQDALHTAQAAQAAAQAAQADAERQDAEMAAALQVAQQNLASAQDEVNKQQALVDEQLKLVGSDARLQVQQNSTLVGLGMLVTNISTGDINDRMHWTLNSFSAVADHLDDLKTELAVLQTKRDALTAAEQAAQQARDAAVAHLQQTQQMAQAAAQAAAAVADQVAANQAALDAAQALLAQAAANNDALKQQADALADQIQQRNAAMAAAAAAAKAAAVLTASNAQASWISTNIAPGQLPALSVDQAVARAQSMNGNMNYGNMCLALVAAFYGYTSAGVDSAAMAASMAASAGQMHYDMANIPVGALVFYNGNPVGNPYGHVAMYAGNGMIYSNGAANGGVGLISINTPAQGWGEPVIGWSSVWLPYATH